MKKICAVLLLFLVLLCLPACQTEQDAKYDALVSTQKAEASALASEFEVDYNAPNYIGPSKPSEDAGPTPVPGDGLSGKLVISAFASTLREPEINWLAKEFMDMHPGVEIEVQFEIPSSWDGSAEEVRMKRDAYYTRLRTEMASGEADYLLYGASGGLDYAGLARSGVLQDLGERLEGDPDIDKDSLFMPVLEAFRVDGKLPIMPYAFTTLGAYLRKDVLAELDVDPAGLSVVDAESVLGWYEQARVQYPELRLYFSGAGKDTLFPTEMPRYIDLENTAPHFDSPEFTTFLERSRKVSIDEPNLEAEDLGTGTGLFFEAAMAYQSTGEVPASVTVIEDMAPSIKRLITQSQPAFCTVSENVVYDLLTWAQPDTFSYVAGPFPLASTNGRLGLRTVGSTDFAMPSSLKNGDLAWEFIKYCLSDREKLGFDHYGYTGARYYCRDSLPVNRNNFVMLTQVAAEDAKMQNGACMEYYDFQPVNGDEMLALMDELLTHDPVDLGKYNIDLQDYLDEFYVNELTTPEQTAEKIQGRAYIWLNE